MTLFGIRLNGSATIGFAGHNIFCPHFDTTEFVTSAEYLNDKIYELSNQTELGEGDPVLANPPFSCFSHNDFYLCSCFSAKPKGVTRVFYSRCNKNRLSDWQ